MRVWLQLWHSHQPQDWWHQQATTSPLSCGSSLKDFGYWYHWWKRNRKGTNNMHCILFSWLVYFQHNKISFRYLWCWVMEKYVIKCIKCSTYWALGNRRAKKKKTDVLYLIFATYIFLLFIGLYLYETTACGTHEFSLLWGDGKLLM